jgi:hypothetical protein
VTKRERPDLLFEVIRLRYPLKAWPPLRLAFAFVGGSGDGAQWNSWILNAQYATALLGSAKTTPISHGLA